MIVNSLTKVIIFDFNGWEKLVEDMIRVVQHGLKNMSISIFVNRHGYTDPYYIIISINLYQCIYWNNIYANNSKVFSQHWSHFCVVIHSRLAPPRNVCHVSRHGSMDISNNVNRHTAQFICSGIPCTTAVGKPLWMPRRRADRLRRIGATAEQIS